MPHVRNGQEVKVGDVVTVLWKRDKKARQVVEVYPDLCACVVAIPGEVPEVVKTSRVLLQAHSGGIEIECDASS